MTEDVSTKLNLLVSFAYFKQALPALQENASQIRLLIDSGAFTAWKAGKPINLDDYCRFIEALPVEPWRYFMLDVIGDPVATRRNYETMLTRGFRPIPIFTRGEDPTAIEEMYRSSDVVGIGGLVGTRGNRGFVNGIMKVVGARRVHWLGFTREEFLKTYRPYSVDSSSWEQGARYAVPTVYMGHGKFQKIRKCDFATKADSAVMRRIRSLGGVPENLRLEKEWSGYTASRALAATSAVSYSLDVQKYLGSLLFNVATTRQATELLLAGFRHLVR